MKNKVMLCLMVVTVCCTACGKKEKVVEEEPTDFLTEDLPGMLEEPISTPTPEPIYVDPSTYSLTVSEEGEYPIRYEVAGSDGMAAQYAWFHGTEYVNAFANTIYDFVCVGIAKLYDNYDVTDDWYCDYVEDVLGYTEDDGLAVVAHSDSAELCVVFYGDYIYEYEGVIGLTEGHAGNYPEDKYVTVDVVRPYGE